MKFGIVTNARGMWRSSPVGVTKPSFFTEASTIASSSQRSVRVCKVRGNKNRLAKDGGRQPLILHVDFDLDTANRTSGACANTDSTDHVATLSPANASATLHSTATRYDEEVVILRKRRLRRWLLLRNTTQKQPPTEATSASKRQRSGNSRERDAGVPRGESSPLKRSIVSKDEMMRLTGLPSISPVRSSKRPRFLF